jgi:hypothetical protein
MAIAPGAALVALAFGQALMFLAGTGVDQAAPRGAYDWTFGYPLVAGTSG